MKSLTTALVASTVAYLIFTTFPIDAAPTLHPSTLLSSSPSSSFSFHFNSMPATLSSSSTLQKRSTFLQKRDITCSIDTSSDGVYTCPDHWLCDGPSSCRREPGYWWWRGGIAVVVMVVVLLSWRRCRNRKSRLREEERKAAALAVDGAAPAPAPDAFYLQEHQQQQYYQSQQQPFQFSQVQQQPAPPWAHVVCPQQEVYRAGSATAAAGGAGGSGGALKDVPLEPLPPCYSPPGTDFDASRIAGQK